MKELQAARNLGRIIAIDVRNLAVLRIGLAIVILVDLFQRIGSIEEFCSDQGVLNRELNQWLCPPSEGFWSLYWLNGSTGFATGLMAINAVVAVCLLLGWQTRLATAVCLVLAYSLQMRNPLILTAGHILLRMLLFWSLFLPLGAVWSLDAWRKRGKSGSVGRPATARDEIPAIAQGMRSTTAYGRYGRVISIATAAVMIQIAAMYLFSGIAKWNDVWLRGEAMSLAMQLDMYVKPLGRELLQFPQLLMLLTFLILLLETIGPLLLWMPIGNAHWRAGLLVLFWLMHIGIWLTMSIGIFSAVAMLAWVVFLPREFWAWFARRPSKWIPSTEASDGSQNWQRLGLIPSFACGAFLVYIVALNIANIEPKHSHAWFRPELRKIGNATMTLQQFKMFERPAKENLWWRLVAYGQNGALQDALGPNHKYSFDERPAPNEIYDAIPSQFWRRLLFNLATMTESEGAQLKAIRERCARALWRARPLQDRWDRELDWRPTPSLYLFRKEISLDGDESLSSVEHEDWGEIVLELPEPR